MDERNLFKLLIGIPVGIALMFAGLKVTGAIDWDCIWILSPIWMPLGIILTFYILYLIVMLILSL